MKTDIQLLMKESIIYPHTRVPENVVEEDEEQSKKEYEDEMYTSTRVPVNE